MPNDLLTIRIPKDLDRQISTLAKKFRLSRSDIVRMALRKFTEESLGGFELSPYEKVKNLVGAMESGISDLGSDHRRHLIKRIRRA